MFCTEKRQFFLQFSIKHSSVTDILPTKTPTMFILLQIANTNDKKGGIVMAKSRQINHEYYANYETCRNAWFDMYDVDEQDEDYTLDYYQTFETGEDDDD